MKPKIHALIAVLLLVTAVSCVTTSQVKEIVANSNAAMVEVPDLPQANRPIDEKKLEAAIERIETIIATHPDQTVLINTLRVRQAMLLTVHGKLEAAAIVWGKTAAPTGERDRALYDLNEKLVWWFRAAKRFGDADIAEAEKAKAKFETVCKGLTPGSGIRMYLETMRAAIALAKANKQNTRLTDDEKRKQAQLSVASEMVAALDRLASQFDPETDGVWVTANWKSTETFPDVPVSVVRSRVELRRMIQEYFKRARLKKLEEFQPLQWKPGWVQTLWTKE